MIVRKYIDQLYKYFYVILFLGYIIFVKIPEFRIGVVCTVLMLLIGVKFFRKHVSKMGATVFLIMLWTMLSILFVDPLKTPYSVICREFTNVVFPMFFFFAGEKYVKKDGQKDFYDLLVVAILICFFCGVFWYVSEPEYYLIYLQRIGYTTSWETYHLDHRFCSFLGSIGIGLLGNCGLIISLSRWCTEHRKKHLLETICMYIMIILSMQRSAYVMMILFTIWILIKNKVFKDGFWVMMVMIVFLGTLLSVVMGYKIVGPNISQIGERILRINVVDLFIPRLKIWRPVFEVGARLIIGLGIGSCGIGGEIPVTDGAVIKILGETGFIGILLWSVVIVFVLRRMLLLKRCNKNITIPLLIMLAYGINSIGSNCIVFMEMAPIFWFAIGSVSSKYCSEKGIK